MKIRKKFIVFLSILFLGTGVLIGCEGEGDQDAVPPAGQEAAPPGAAAPGSAPVEPQDQAATEPAPEQSREQATAEPAQEPPAATSGNQQPADQGSAGGSGTMAQSGTQDQQAGQPQAGENWVGKQVVSQDGKELGTVAALHDSGYIMIKGEGDKLHPVPANLLKEDSQGDRLTAQFDQNTFNEAPSFSEAEQQQLSDSQLEQVRGYYENKAQGGQQMPSDQSQNQSQSQDSQFQKPQDQSQGQDQPQGTETQKQGS
jgi:hypothetical protein